MAPSRTFLALVTATLLLLGALHVVAIEPAGAQTQTIPCDARDVTLGAGTHELEPGCTYTDSFTILAGDGEVVIEGNGATIAPRRGDCLRHCGLTAMVKFGFNRVVIRDLTLAGGSNNFYVGGLNINVGGPVRLERVTIDDNRGGLAGGIYVPDDTSLTIVDSTISNNWSLTNGGGIMTTGDNVHIELINTTVSGNRALGSEQGGSVGPGAGGGILFSPIFENEGSLTLRNSTVSGNTATRSQGGGIGIFGRSGARVTIEHSTITANEGAGLANLGYSGSVAISGTVVGGNFTDGAREDCNIWWSPDILVWDMGYNARGVGCRGFDPTSVSLSAGPRVGPLRHHGGPTMVHLPNRDSVLVDHIPVNAEGVCATGVTTDQRGVARPQGEGCDIGAVEREPVVASAPSVTIDQAAGQADPTSASPIEFTVVFSEPVTAFDATDVDLSASTTGGTLEAAVTDTGDATTYSVEVTGMTGAGDVTASVFEGAASDEAGNPSEASTSTDGTVTYDASGPVVSGAVADPNPVLLDEVTSLSATADDTTGGGTISGASYSVDGDPPVAMGAVDGAFDGPVEEVSALIDTSTLDGEGNYEVCVTASDELGNVGAPACTILVVSAVPAEPGVDVELDDPVIGDGSRFHASGTLTCPSEQVFVLELLLTQGEAQAHGDTRGICTGESQPFLVRLFTGSGSELAGGPVEACFTLRSALPGSREISEEISVCQEVAVSLP